MRPTNTQQNMFLRIAKMPVRALCRARDLYVRSMGSCAASVRTGNLGCSGDHYDALPRSFSMGSSRLSGDEDFKELLRAASMKSLGTDQIDMDALLKALKTTKPAPSSKMSKSCSVGMGRIDEDAEEGNYEEDSKRGNRDLNLYANRSRSTNAGL